MLLELVFWSSEAWNPPGIVAGYPQVGIKVLGRRANGTFLIAPVMNAMMRVARNKVNNHLQLGKEIVASLSQGGFPQEGAFLFPSTFLALIFQYTFVFRHFPAKNRAR